MAKNQNNAVAPATQKTEPGAKKDALATALAATIGTGSIVGVATALLAGGPGLAAEKSKLDGMDIGNGLQLVSTGRYAGLFVEDGSDKTVSDVFCIRVKNTGSSDVQYAHITLTRGSECYEFDISTLPAGQTLQALELGAQTMPEKPEELTVTVTAYAAFAEPLSMHDDLFTVTTSDNTITVTNNSGAAAAQVYVYYKNVSGDMLLGGITYRAGVKDLAAGESQSSYTSHFHEGASALLFVTYVP